jgi:hypothetical protein
VLLAGDGGIVLGGRVASIDGGRVVIDLDGAAPERNFRRRITARRSGWRRSAGC